MPRHPRARVDAARDPRKVSADVATRSQGFVSSAAVVARERIVRPGSSKKWQDELWDFYDTVGEFGYANNWLANSCSRADIDVEVQQDDGTWVTAPPTDPGRVYLDELFDSVGGQEEYVRTVSLHVSVCGESWTVGEELLNPAGEITGYRWSVVSSDDFERDANRLYLIDPETEEKREVTDDALPIRTWRPHPRRRAEAYTSAKGVRGPLREIVNVSKHISATVDSRLAGNGVLIMPKDVSITTTEGVTTEGNALAPGDADPFMTVLAAVMTQTIADRDSAAAVTPIVLRMQGEFIDKVQHITFGTEFDAQAIPLRQDSVKRTALGLDMPPEQLLGMTDANHWSSWQIEEAGVKVTVEPVLKLIVNALTHQFIRPLLAAAGIPGKRRVVYDVTNLILRPNRSADADAAYDRATITSEAYRAAKGFDDDDAPNIDEIKFQLAVALVRAGHVDALAAQIFNVPADTAAPSSTPTALPAGDTTDTTATPDTPIDGSVTAACQVLMLRAMEYAGHRLRPRGTSFALANVPLYETHLHVDVDSPKVARALDGAFTLAPAVLEPLVGSARASELTRRLTADAALMLTTKRSPVGWAP